MSSLAYSAPISLLLVALAFFHAAEAHRQRKIGRFDLLYTLGHLLILSAAFLVYAVLDFGGSAVAGGIFAFFQLILWLYVIIVMFLVLRLLMNMIRMLMAVVREKRGLGAWVKIYF